MYNSRLVSTSRVETIQFSKLFTVKYYEFLGLKQIHKMSYPEHQFDLYFLAYDPPDSASSHWSDRQGVLQLGHKHGSESNDDFKIANGNSDPGKGFGHVCISVDNVQAACQRIEGAGYPFKKKLSDGRMKDIAFALDPDDYWVYMTRRGGSNGCDLD